jgi:hypothetical protein
MLGVVRSDGILLPLASRGNEAWTNLRSYDSDGRGLFRLVDAPRVPREGWTYVPWNAGAPLPLAVRDMVTIDARCNRQEGFSTNAPPPDPKLDASHLMSGIAIHGDAAPGRIENVAHRPDATSRRTRVPVQITTLARDRVGEVDYYYFEAHKRYGAVESYASGWLASSPFSVSVVSVDGGIYGGGETVRRRGRVLGVLRIGQASVWVMEMRAYESDSYEIVEMPRTGQVVSISGGGC